MPVTVTVLVALFVCLIPTTIGGLLSAIGIAGMDRMIQANVIATVGRAVEAAGDVDVLLLDKTGTITLGNRQAVEFYSGRWSRHWNAGRRRTTCHRWPTKRRKGRALSFWPKKRYGLRGRKWEKCTRILFPFRRKRGSAVSISTAGEFAKARPTRSKFVHGCMANCLAMLRRRSNDIAKQGGTPLVVADGNVRWGDPSEGHRQRRHQRTICRAAADGHQNGDDHRRQSATAAAIAAEAGVDDFLAQATPEAKLKMIRDYQAADDWWR